MPLPTCPSAGRSSRARPTWAPKTARSCDASAKSRWAARFTWLGLLRWLLPRVPPSISCETRNSRWARPLRSRVRGMGVWTTEADSPTRAVSRRICPRRSGELLRESELSRHDCAQMNDFRSLRVNSRGCGRSRGGESRGRSRGRNWGCRARSRRARWRHRFG